jgi:acetyltransferase-like isoleucine patch superfamily enzyme
LLNFTFFINNRQDSSIFIDNNDKIVVKEGLEMSDSSWVDPEYDDHGITQWGWRVNNRENFKLGNNARIGSFTMIDARHGVEIEDDVLIGYGCIIISFSRMDNKHGKIILKKGCKIGSQSILMPGITIGENSVIGANSYVDKSVPDGEVWLGTPARFQRSVTEI